MMKTFLTSLFLAGLLAVSATAAAADPIMGTWKLSAAKSKMNADNMQKSQTRVYSQSGDSISVVITSVAADGKESTTKSTYKLDGKDYPVMGPSSYDSLSGKQVDANTAEFTLKKGGKTVGTTTRTVSKDGKTMTSTGSSGGKDQGTLVFDKQ